MSFRACSLFLTGCFALFLTGCSPSSPDRKSTTFAAGDKIPVDKLTYSIVDTQILPHLGDEASPRMPQNRFYVVQLSVLNSGSSDVVIPGMTLIDDSGKTYEELSDGTGVTHWLGVARKVASNQIEQGSVVFDAPSNHYKLKLTDETDPDDILVDLPLSFAHEQLQNETGSNPDASTEEKAPTTTILKTKKK